MCPLPPPPELATSLRGLLESLSLVGGEKVLSKDLIQIFQDDHQHYLCYKNNLPFLNQQSRFLVSSERDVIKYPLSLEINSKELSQPTSPSLPRGSVPLPST